jgi:hypothetical protein
MSVSAYRRIGEQCFVVRWPRQPPSILQLLNSPTTPDFLKSHLKSAAYFRLIARLTIACAWSTIAARWSALLRLSA